MVLAYIILKRLKLTKSLIVNKQNENHRRVKGCLEVKNEMSNSAYLEPTFGVSYSCHPRVWVF